MAPETDADSRKILTLSGESTNEDSDRTTDPANRDLLGALAYNEDARSTDPNRTGHRRARFKVGWRDAIEGDDYGENSLDRLTWQNLGWRLGQLFGPTPEPLQDDLYDWWVCRAAGRVGAVPVLPSLAHTNQREMLPHDLLDGD